MEFYNFDITIILDSEYNGECIDFNMMYVLFYPSETTIISLILIRFLHSYPGFLVALVNGMVLLDISKKNVQNSKSYGQKIEYKRYNLQQMSL